MLGFFNKKNSVIAGIQTYNIIAFVFAAYDLYTNPEASWDEQGVALAINAINILSLREGTPIIQAIGTSALNFAGLGAVFRGLTSDWSSVSPAINIIAAAGHFVSAVGAATVGCNSEEAEEADEPSVKLNPH